MNNVIRVNFGPVVDDEDFGVVTLGPHEDLLSTSEVAKLLGITASGWRALVSQGYAPKADDPGSGPVNRRSPRWLRSTVEAHRDRPPRRMGRPRKAQ